MPFMPFLNALKAKADMQDKFLGYYNHPAADAGQFVDEENLTSDLYPVMSPRKQRRLIRVLGSPRAIRGGAELSWIANGKLYYDGREICDVNDGHDVPNTLNWQGGRTEVRQQLVRMGAYLIVWPARIIYNTHTGEMIDMDARVEASTVIVRPCTLTGHAYDYAAGPEPPADPDEQSYWWNTDTDALYQYLGGEWQGIDTVYTRLEVGGMEGKFHDYDVVKLEGFSYDWLNAEAATVYAANEDYIVIATGTLVDYEETAGVVISREAPEMDFICESGNRLWGCSSKTHEIRGSKLGDPTNWSSYLGISTDSYAATVGSAGDWTGIVQYMGYVHFFKENCVHRLYGTQPSNFQLVELPVRGLKEGCERSLCTVNQILYYVSRDGVMAFDGSSPVNVGEALGDVTLDECVAGAHDDKMYLWARVTNRKDRYTGAAIIGGTPTLYVMDAGKGLWHKEDFSQTVRGMASTPEGDFILSDAGLWLIDGGRSAYEDADVAGDEGAVSWYGVTGDIGMDAPGHKWVRKIVVRLAMEAGSRMAIDIEYDSDGIWQRAITVETELKKSLSLSIRTRRCDHFRLRYMGTGDARVYSVAKTFEVGSERGTMVARK